MIVKDIRNKYILCCCTLMFFCSTICSKSFRYNGLKYNIISEDKLDSALKAAKGGDIDTVYNKLYERG